MIRSHPLNRRAIRKGICQAVLLAVAYITPIGHTEEVPYHPTPLAIELHPPFSGRCWGLGQTEAGALIVGGEGHVGIFDGLSWRHIITPNIMACGFIEKRGRIWVTASETLGWISTATGDDAYHIVLNHLNGPVILVYDVGENILVVTFDTFLLVDPTGRILDQYRLPYSSLRHHFRYREGIVFISRRDSFFVRADRSLHVSTAFDLPNTFLQQMQALSAVYTNDKVYLFGAVSSYELTETGRRRLEQPGLANSLDEHPINVIKPESWHSVVRVGSELVKAFDVDTLIDTWQLRIGEELEGTIPVYPIVNGIGVFLGTSKHVYWIPSDTAARRLTGIRQKSNHVGSSKGGFWVNTDGGSWQIENSNWSPRNASTGATWMTTETKLGKIRSRINSLEIGSQHVPMSDVGGFEYFVQDYDDGIIFLQNNHVWQFDHDLRIVKSTEAPYECNSLAVAPDGSIFIGCTRRGAWKLDPAGTWSCIRSRGDLSARVGFYRGQLAVLWTDGRLEVGDTTLELPAFLQTEWTQFAFSSDSIVVAGRAGDRAMLVSASEAAGQWDVRALDHPALDLIGAVEAVAISGDCIAISGAGGCFEFARKFFAENASPPAPGIAMINTTDSRESITNSRTLRSSETNLRLRENEDELSFTVSGSSEYWRQRVQFRYRLKPDSSAWTVLDPTNTVKIERIGAGEHTLEIEARSPGGMSVSEYRIARPPYWYASRWAYSGYAALLVGSGVGTMLLRTRRLRERARVLEERVEQRTAELKKANEAKDEFLASMSHEIRNPLNGVVGIAGMIRESAAQERDRQLAESLHACADQLRLVLDDVLDFSRIERGEIELRVAPFAPAAVIRSAAVSVDTTLVRTRIVISPEVAGLWLRGDEGKVRQIVSNLVSNAHKYGLPPEAEIHVCYRDGRLEIAVSNTGQNIPAEDQSRIFGSFERGRTQRHKYVSGVGLGLTISSRFAQAMGGTLTVESANGLTCFTFSVLMEPVEKPAQSSASAATSARGRALAIEDENYNRLVMGHVLAQLGFDVDWAQNASAALEIFAGGANYQLIFTDWMLPDMSGAELVQKLQQLGGSATPAIIAVTAYATADKRAEAIAAGVAGFITKPITREKILATLPSAPQAGNENIETAETAHESLRFGVLLDCENPTERIADFNAHMNRRMMEIDAALAAKDGDSAVRSAHQLASQVLSIHHHTFADRLRAIERCAAQQEWSTAVQLQALNRDAATDLSISLMRLQSAAGSRTSPGLPAKQ